MIGIKLNEACIIDYENYRGERAYRLIRPTAFLYGISDYHKGRQFFLEAVDLDRGVLRQFAIADIKDVIEVSGDEAVIPPPKN